MSLDSLEGDLQQTQLSKVLFLLGVQEANGILTVQGEEDIVAVSFVQGAIVTADALNQTVEDGLGKVLQGKKWISPDQFNAAAREHQGGSSGSLGDLLVDKGLITRKQLLDALRLQTLRSMLQLMTWKSGDFKFYSGDEVSFEEGFVPIGTDELILRAVSKLGDRAGLSGSIPDDSVIYRPVPTRGQVKVVGRDGDGTEPGLWISPLQADFLSKVDGRTSPGDLSKTLGLSRQQLLFALYHLTQHDLIESSGKGAGSAAASAAPSAVGPGAAAPGAVGPAAAAPGAVGPGASGDTLSSPDTIPFADEPSFGDSAFPGSAPEPGPSAAGPMPRPTGELSGAMPRPTGELSGAVPRPAVPPRSTGEVFRPPEAAPAAPAPSTEVIEADDKVLEWVGPGLAAVALLGIALALFARPVALLLPFPWQQNSRSTVERQVRESLFRRIDRGARTYFLMEAHYPDTLSTLRDLHLISSVDLQGPAGHELQYTTEEVSYAIQLRKGDQVIEGLGTKEAITGDFLVDPQFLGNAAMAEDPVVLLD